MDMLKEWIEYLDNPLVLAGFALAVVASLIKLFKTEKLTRDATKVLISKTLNYIFILGLLIICLGFGLKYFEINKNNNESSLGNESPKVEQSMSNTSGTSTQSAGNTNFGGNQTTHTENTVRVIKQEMKNTKGISTQSGGNTNVNEN